MNLRSVVIAVVANLVVVAVVAAADKIEPFEQEGVIMDLHRLFPAVAKAAKGMKADAIQQPELSGRAFVSSEGVYAFLETPENKQALQNVASGTPAKIKGKLLTSGLLLHIDGLAKVAQPPDIDLKKYADDKGTPVHLDGTNKCQCGLSVGELPHSCTLGHLHHLEATDGKIYHYAQVGDGQSAFLGRGMHFKRLTLRGWVFPGNFVLVEQAQVSK